MFGRHVDYSQLVMVLESIISRLVLSSFYKSEFCQHGPPPIRLNYEAENKSATVYSWQCMKLFTPFVCQMLYIFVFLISLFLDVLFTLQNRSIMKQYCLELARIQLSKVAMMSSSYAEMVFGLTHLIACRNQFFLFFSFANPIIGIAYLAND